MSQKSNIVRISKKGSNVLLILLLVLFLAFVIGLGFFVSQRQEEKQKSESIDSLTGKTEKKKTEKISKKEEEKENEKKKEEKKEDQTKEEQKTISYSDDFFFVDYPDSWQVKKINSKTVGFFVKEATSGLGDVTISYKENKSNLPIERFYDGINDVNLFEDAAGGFVKTSVSNYEAFKFKNLVGETNSTMLVIKLDKAFLEISDNFSKHQEDGIFDGFVESLKVK
ncbi:MAG: hypothetical protein AB1465_02750 [Patescibacteria group bacterium]